MLIKFANEEIKLIQEAVVALKEYCRRPYGSTIQAANNFEKANKLEELEYRLKIIKYE